MAKSIVVIGGKGGLGKTTVTLNIAREKDAYIVSNDKMSKLARLCEENEVNIVDNIKYIDDDVEVVYDFAGYVDANMIEIVSKADVVVFVTTCDILAYSQLVEYIADLLPHNDNAFIVANKLGLFPKTGEKKKEAFDRELELIEKKVAKQFGLEVFPIKASPKIHDSFENGLSLNEGLAAYKLKGAWKPELTQINNIMERIENGRKN